MMAGKINFKLEASERREVFRPRKNALDMRLVAEAFQLRNLKFQESDDEFINVDLSVPYDLEALSEHTGQFGTAHSPYIVTGDHLHAELGPDFAALFKSKLREAGMVNIKQSIIDRAIQYFSSQMQVVVQPSVPPAVAATLYYDAAAQLGPDTRVQVEEEQQISINGPLHNVASKILMGVDLQTGELCLVKLLPMRRDEDKNARSAELRSYQLLTLDDLPLDSPLVPAKRLMIKVPEDHAVDLGLAANQRYDALQLPWYTASLTNLPKLSRALLYRGGKCIEAALQIMHERGLVHADVKADNVFVDRDGSWHLGDYGSVVRVGEPIWSCTRVSF
jgi:hypothetical protein